MNPEDKNLDNIKSEEIKGYGLNMEEAKDQSIADVLKKHGDKMDIMNEDTVDQPIDDLTADKIASYNLPDHQVPVSANLPVAQRKKVALETAKKMNVIIDNINNKNKLETERSGELDNDMSEYMDKDVSDELDENITDTEIDRGVKVSSSMGDTDFNAEEEINTINNEKHYTIEVESNSDDADYVDKDVDTENAPDDGDYDLDEDQDDTPDDGEYTPKEVKETEASESKVKHTPKDGTIVEEETEVNGTRPTSDSEYNKYITQNNLRLQDLNNVDKAPRRVNAPTMADDDMLDALIAKKGSAKRSLSRESIHGVQTIMIHSEYIGHTQSLSHADLDDIDKIALGMDSRNISKATYIKIINFLYKHLSTSDSGFDIPDIDTFKKVTSWRDIKLMCYDLIRATWVEKAIPFNFECDSPACSKLKEPTLITHGAIAEDLQQVVPNKFKKIIKKAKDIESYMGDTEEWLKQSLANYRELLNFEDSCGVVIELQGQSIDRFLASRMTDDDAKNISKSANNENEQDELILQLEMRNIVSKIRRMFIVGADDLLHNVPKGRWEYVIAELLGAQEKGILSEACDRIEGEDMVQYCIKKAVCPTCQTAHTNIRINPLDMLFSIRAAYGRGWGVEKDRKQEY